jgi:hypothetical protein
MLVNLIFGPQQTTEKLNDLIPDFHKLSGQVQFPAGGVLMKSHLRLTPTMPLLDQTSGFIYVVRDPMDVMMSNLNYARMRENIGNDPEICARFREAYIEKFIEQGGDPEWIRYWHVSWIGHVRSWIGNAPGFPNLVLRYEEMLQDPAGQLGRIRDFLKFDFSDDDVRAAAANSSFARMKGMEESELTHEVPGIYLSEHSESSIAAGLRFIHRGEAGVARRELTEAQQAQFIARFGATMALAGYQT